ncbi:glycosyltransferase [Vibrio sp. Y2-5]|uniref:glycosyltransferase n=1 Tax=Vibrio sp. Y2-5 TaxID=2743977 RepID=UPI0016617CA1|nr:glycosyltransferase [Vibrio sp. Y2-5]MBD0787969.1 glycosyltransferase [Vibrio sp. Y2-5]
MALFISVVNHNHDEMISANDTLKNLAQKHTVIIKSNTEAKTCLKQYCQKSGIHLIQGSSFKGFGANNNEVFKVAKTSFNMCKEDYFLVLNPDIEISLESISSLLTELQHTPTDIAAINLFRNRAMTEYDNSIRHYPKLLNPFKTLLRLPRKDFYDKSVIKQPISIDWAAGSFLLFKTGCYQELKGFDEKYFMYFEDVDICRRANELGLSIIYFPQIKAKHLAAYDNRNFFSKNFRWYLTSSLKYHFSIK